ncbi:MAG: DegV family protein [Erysipelotrichaceae bacterium]|nr:DegV family protein [Erysipelotrichaceae bacterium]
MKRVLIITDSNAGILQSEAKELGIKIVPMPFIINGEEYYEDINLSQKEFYEKLQNENASISTSQPSTYYLRELWDECLKDYEEIVYIPMSSGLSASQANAQAQSTYYKGRVQVVDNQRISVTQKESVLEALELVKLGKTAKEIREYLENTKDIASIYIVVDTLKYLKKGGRVTPAGAALGTILRIKPVLQIRGKKLDAFFKAMNIKQAKLKMISQVKYDLENDFKQYYEEGKMVISIAHTQNFEEAEKFKDDIIKMIPGVIVRFVDSLSLSVSCHIGPGALAIACCIKNY